jgi:hypothetical protein
MREYDSERERISETEVAEINRKKPDAPGMF